MNVSVVISTLDRPEMVCESLRALSNLLPAITEVIVVDAGHEKPVDPQCLSEIWPPTVVLRSQEKNISLQRNMGVLHAKGDVCLILDDDAVVQPGWFDAMLLPFGNPRVASVAGAIWCNPMPQFTAAKGGYVTWYGEVVQTIHRSHDAPRDVTWPNGGNVGFRRAAFLAIGGFGSVFSFYDEDVDIGLRLRKAGWEIVFAPDGVVHHFMDRQPAKPMTKKRMYVAGRSRGAMLIRNYGFRGTALVYFAYVPWRDLLTAVALSLRDAWRHCGHAGAHLFGVAVGVCLGLKNSVKDDELRLSRLALSLRGKSPDGK